MNATTPRFVLKSGILMVPLALVACGGGGSAVCNNPNPAVCAAVGSAPVSNPPAAITLFTTAPTAVTLTAGTGITYGVGGGTPPYTATSGNPNVGKASISGTALSISSIAPGTAPIAVVDSLGKAINMALTVLAQGQAGAPLSISPAALTVGVCTTNIPFVFMGGVAPYTVFTSDNFLVPVSSALPLGPNSYFTATIKASAPSAVLTVLDSQSQSATSTITVRGTHATCPDNPLLQISPASANFRQTEILAFQVVGGPPLPVPPELLPKITFRDSTATTNTATSTVAKVVLNSMVQNSTGISFNVQALNVGTTLMTVTTSDGQSSNVTMTVLPNVLP